MRWIKNSTEAPAQLLGLSPLRNEAEPLAMKRNLTSDNERDFQARAQTPNQSIRKSRIGKNFSLGMRMNENENFVAKWTELVMQILTKFKSQ